MSLSGHAETFTVELPSDVLPPIADTPEVFARELRLAAAIEWYRQGRISQGRAAEVAGMNRVDFLDALYRAKVPACQATVDEVLEEAARVVAAHRERLASDRPGAVSSPLAGPD
jgi:predicted HTH domain antitoxin